jgi:hypothetical protein
MSKSVISRIDPSPTRLVQPTFPKWARLGPERLLLGRLSVNRNARLPTGITWEEPPDLGRKADQLVTPARKPRPCPVRPPFKGKLAIGTPAHGGNVALGCIRSLVATATLLAKRGIAMNYLAGSGHALAHMARNFLAADFLAGDASHLLVVDADMEWTPADVLRLIEHDLDAVCATYLRKDDSGHYVLAASESGRVSPSGAVEIEAAGLGFMLVKRRVVERMAETGVAPKFEDPVLERDHPGLHNWFPTRFEAGTIQGEDFSFCRLWRSLGGSIWCDTTIRLAHHGPWAF